MPLEKIFSEAIRDIDDLRNCVVESARFILIASLRAKA